MTITYCDMDDCRNTGEEFEMYTFTEKAAEKYRFSRYDDICQECLDEYLSDGSIDENDIVIEWNQIYLKEEY